MKKREWLVGYEKAIRDFEELFSKQRRFIDMKEKEEGRGFFAVMDAKKVESMFKTMKRRLKKYEKEANQ